MKHIIAFLMATAFVLAATAAEVQPSLLERLSLSPVGAYRQAGFTGGPSEYGAGVDVGLKINEYVGIHCRNLTFQSNDHATGIKGKDGLAGVRYEDDWGGSAIDETSVYAKADFKPFSSDQFYLFGTGGGSRHWSSDDWSFGVGAGVEYRFTRNISASIAREVRAYFKGTKDWLSTASVNLSF